MKNYENIPNPDLFTDKQAAKMVKNMPQYLALLDFKKDGFESILRAED